ncbi:MAG: lauroyl acyltransferase [Bacteroidia bacterium]|nr:lauroyl acyltransferase [Bacteroidia bacterium]
MEWIEKYWIYGLGFFAQGLFGTRLLVQLFYTERAGRVVSPTIFWQISLVASFLFLIYGVLRDDVVIILGQTLSYFIYIRNLQLKASWRGIPLAARVILIVLPFSAFGWMFFGSNHSFAEIVRQSDWSHPILILGAIGQLLLNLRFLYQWYHSEKVKSSILPFGFWLISTVGSVAVIIYAVYRLDPVLLVAQSMGILVYIRNMFLNFRPKTTGAG